MVDAHRIRANWARVADHGDRVPRFFYAALFLSRPQTRELFPLDLAERRHHWLRTVAAVVASIDDPAAVAPRLRELGREHRTLGLRAEHYPAVGAALSATLRRFSGPDWDPELATAWGEVHDLVTRQLVSAAEADTGPPWWQAEVVAHERRGGDTAVLTLSPDRPLPYRAGQSIGVSSPLRPAVWRRYSPANAPRADGTVELHVRMAEAGDLSTALVVHTSVGDTLRLGPAAGSGLLLDEADDRRILLLAGGTGLSPLRALVDQIAATRPRPVSLYWGARTIAGLYDLPRLRSWHSRYDWFELAACAEEPAPGVLTGNPIDLAVRHGQSVGAEVYVCGPTAMLTAARRALAESGVDAGSIHYETYGSPR